MNKLKNLISYGNKKLPSNTAIFNMDTAKDCKSKKQGFCKLKNCYACKAEKLYPQVLPYRQRQKKYWNNCTPETFTHDLKSIIESKRKKIKYFRFNESGDIRSTKDLLKFFAIASLNKNIQFYIYTKSFNSISWQYFSLAPNNAKIIYSFNNIEEYFTVKNSKDLEYFTQSAFIYVSKEEDIKHYSKIYNMRICKGNCRICSYCKVKNNNIVLVKQH